MSKLQKTYRALTQPQKQPEMGQNAQNEKNEKSENKKILQNESYQSI